MTFSVKVLIEPASLAFKRGIAFRSPSTGTAGERRKRSTLLMCALVGSNRVGIASIQLDNSEYEFAWNILE